MSKNYIEMIEQACVYDVADVTPLDHARKLSQQWGNTILLKREDLQPVFSFKLRGAYNKMASLTPEECRRGVCAASAGNHAQGVAMSARRLGIDATIVMPKTTPTVKVMMTESVGGNVVLEGETFDEASAYARTLQHERNLTFVHPFDHPHVAAGQGTVALEMLEDVHDLETIIVPVGGGGLISGVATAAKAINPKIKIMGVQTAEFPAFYNLFTGRTLPQGGPTLAEGIAVKEPGAFTRQVIMEMVDDMRVVKEAAIEEAISLLLDIEKTVVEGAGATGLATLLPKSNGDKRKEFLGKKIGIILTGGNIEQRFLANVILRNLVRSGRIGRVSVLLDDRAGALSRISQIFTDYSANIIEVTHQRVFGNLSAKNIRTDIEYEVRDQRARDRLLQALEDAGYKFDVITLQGNVGSRFNRTS